MDRSAACTAFLETLEFELYPFQEEALLAWFESEGGVLVSAPTGMGKTLVAEAAIFEALSTGQRLYYSTPLIALTDQKFREFQEKAERWGFPRTAIGLITGNRRENPDARVRVVVAEVLLNHLLAEDASLAETSAVVMDEFHYFNDAERGMVWELSLVLLPRHVRLMLLSATVGNSVDFVRWLREEHDRKVLLVQTQERRVPLEFVWVGDKLLSELLPAMVRGDDAENRSPALVFCFNRDECWEIADRLKGVGLIDAAVRTEIEARMAEYDLSQGIGPRLRQMLIRGVGVHHAGVLPRHKELIEELFLRKLIPFVTCTETLAAGINLPARSVVLTTLLKGKPGERKLVFASTAHQMFGRAGRPQFDRKGYVYALAHEDDARIEKWRRKYEALDTASKDPVLLRLRRELERKKPTRRKTEQYWTEGQFRSLIAAGPAKLVSRSMIPYGVLIYLLIRTGSLHGVRSFLSKRFAPAEGIQKFQAQLEAMLANLGAFGFLTRSEDGEQVAVEPRIPSLLGFRSVDPLYGSFLCGQMIRADYQEKLQVLESLLPVPGAILRPLRLPELPPGPLERDVLVPTLVSMGIALSGEGETIVAAAEEEDEWASEDEPRPRMTLPEMLKALFDARLAAPEDVAVQPQWIAGGVLEHERNFFKFIKARGLEKNEGLILRYLLRLIILAGEFHAHSDGDPDYARIGEAVTAICMQVDPRYTDRFLAAESEAGKLQPAV